MLHLHIKVTHIVSIMQISDKKNAQTDAAKLRSWLNKVPYGMYNNVRRTMFNACGVSRATFANWAHGRCAIPPLAKKEMNRVAAMFFDDEIIFDAPPAPNKSEGVSGRDGRRGYASIFTTFATPGCVATLRQLSEKASLSLTAASLASPICDALSARGFDVSGFERTSSGATVAINNPIAHAGGLESAIKTVLQELTKSQCELISE